MKIGNNKFVAVTYDLYVGTGDERELMERATAENPLKFIYGIDMMLPAFEKELHGLEVGSAFDFTIEPAQAYGEYLDDNVAELPKNIFEVDGKFDSQMVQEGATLPMMTTDGQQVNGSVMEIKDDVVVMDFNHPLAGETLHFIGKVSDVHEASAEEIAAMTAPAAGCNCDDCSSDCGSQEHAHSNNGGCGCGGCH